MIYLIPHQFCRLAISEARVANPKRCFASNGQVPTYVPGRALPRKKFEEFSYGERFASYWRNLFGCTCDVVLDSAKLMLGRRLLLIMTTF